MKLLINNPETCSPNFKAVRGNNFNFLRLLFASLVILSHTFEIIDGNRSRELLTRIFGTISLGELAVDGFFLLSGYLILKSWVDDPRILPFLAKRALRIYPGFFAAALVGVFVVGPLGAEPVAYYSQLEFGKIALGMALLKSPVVPPVFTGTPFPVINGSMWTISYEFQCYLLVMLLGVLGLAKHRRRWVALTAIIFGIVLSQRLRHPCCNFLHATVFEDSIFRFGMFFLSGGAYYLFKDMIWFRARWFWVASVVLTLAMFRWTSSELALATIGGYVLFYIALRPIGWLRPFQTLPDVSYGLYLYGFPIQKLIIWYFPQLSAGLVFIFSMLGGLMAGLISWYAIERAFLRLKPSTSH